MLRFIGGQKLQLKGSVVIVSGISIGNVPALTCDEIIKKDQFKRVAYFQTDHIEPSIGYLPEQIEGGSLGLPAEVYQKGSTLILQFRSYCRFARKKDLVKQILQVMKAQGVEEFILISSFPYDIRPDLQISSMEKNIYFKIKGKVTGIDWTENKENKILSISNLVSEQDEESDLMKSGGLASAFHKQAENIALLFIFSQEKQDPKLVKYYQNSISRLINRKEVSQC